MSVKIDSEILNYAHMVKEKYGVPESVTLGQAIYESGLGKSNIANQANNWFGMKGSGNAGQYNGTWAKYNSVYDSFDAYGKLLSKDRYTKHTKNAKTTAQYLQGVVDGGYCPDAGYVTDVLNIINDNNLEQYNTSEYKGTSDITDSETANSDTNVTGIKGILSSITSWVLMLVILILAIMFLINAFS